MKRTSVLFTAAVFALLAITLLSGCGRGNADTATPLARAEIVDPRGGEASTRTLQSWIPYWDQKRALKSFQENVSVMTHLSLFWYRIDAEGNLTTYQVTKEDPSIVRFAQENNVKVMALVANDPDYTEEGVKSWDSQRVDKVISTSEARARHIKDLVQLVESKGFDGVDVDYENLKESQKESFTLFIQELSDALHKRGKLIGIAIHAKTGDKDGSPGSEAQDWAKLHPQVDRMYFMLFGEHGTWSGPGPIATVPWMERVLTYAINDVGVPAKKIVVELGCFAEWWIDGKGKNVVGGLTLAAAENMREDYEAEMLWDPLSRSPHFTFVENGQKNDVWMENGRSVHAKTSLAQHFGIPNVAFWRLGDETPDVWKCLKNFKEGQ